MEQRTQAEPSASELSAELVALGVSPEVIAQATQKAVQARAERETGEQWTTALSGFLVAYRRVSGENVSDSNIEGWYEDYAFSALRVLEAASQQPSLSEGRRQIVRAAAFAYIYNGVEALGFDEEKLAELESYLAACNIDGAEIRGVFKDAYIGLFPEPENDAQRTALAGLARRFESFDEMHGLWGGSPEMWEAVITPIVGKVYDDLKDSGFELPELNEEGKYDFEED